ncbi:MAG: nickel pincer cofactor biosynthesis protein LarB [Planctomycetota bacterium]|nr:nickel pincer cofactor biosynthesis protein LarB [Planctomycetota bacterium]
MQNENEEIAILWSEFQSGKLSAIEMGQRILHAAVQSKGAVTPDLDRTRRCGYPEVIYGAGKSPDSIRTVAEALLKANAELLVTRVTAEQVRTLSEMFTHTRWNHVARTLRIGRERTPLAPESIEATSSENGFNGNDLPGMVAVVSAGTTDEPVALEALETLAWMGLPTKLIQDIGVAGPYRLMAQVPKLQQMSAIVCVAGMEGALPSVLAGHVRCPVIAVPTSVGYGANFAGLSALLSMLNSCAANIAVVNIDAGFKGGYMAGLIAAKKH